MDSEIRFHLPRSLTITSHYWNCFERLISSAIELPVEKRPRGNPSKGFRVKSNCLSVSMNIKDRIADGSVKTGCLRLKWIRLDLCFVVYFTISFHVWIELPEDLDIIVSFFTFYHLITQLIKSGSSSCFLSVLQNFLLREQAVYSWAYLRFGASFTLFSL